MPGAHNPTVRGRRLARELHDLRLRANLMPADVGKRLGWSQQKIMRIEKALSKLSPHDLNELLDLYGVSSPQREALLQLSKDAWKRGWWTAYRDIFSGTFLSLEDEATRIRSWEPQLVPGLLQTPDYARSVTKAIRGEDTPELDRRVAARMARRAILSRPHAPALSLVVDEGALRRLHGGGQVMRAQLESLLVDSKRPNIDLRVIAFSAGSHPGLDGSCTILSFDPEIYSDIAYIESSGGDLYLEGEPEVEQARLQFNRLFDLALSPESTQELLSQLIKEVSLEL
ncbi:helix-turn-helix domain-containing protein [Actinomadura gamaensis]|uniref:Helix-turn-helix domain-containing protein n=1 Tax=Actinomadura gamaensis TaxID=1763541 RepID=A0ABV9TS51_9ACTN